MIPNRKCVICGKDYEYCNSCRQDLGKPSWMTLFDTENCHNIYCTCVDFRDGKITAFEANEKLSKCDLSDIDTFTNGTKGLISKIQNEGKEVKKKIINNENKEDNAKKSFVKK